MILIEGGFDAPPKTLQPYQEKTGQAV